MSYTFDMSSHLDTHLDTISLFQNLYIFLLGIRVLYAVAAAVSYTIDMLFFHLNNFSYLKNLKMCNALLRNP